jgi:hypothetical protein
VAHGHAHQKGDQLQEDDRSDQFRDRQRDVFSLGTASYIVMLLLAACPGAPLGVKFAMLLTP